MSRPKGSTTGPTPETQYVIGEVIHLLTNGLPAEQIPDALNKKEQSLRILLQRNGQSEIAAAIRRATYAEGEL